MTLPALRSLTDFDQFAAALADQYELVRELGRGGMGVVYLARDIALARDVAIKTLPGQLADDAGIRERFLREARTAAALTHPNIVPIHRAAELGGHVFYVMGYVKGESLAAHIAHHGRLSPPVAVRYLRDVADALSYAHTHGLVHRDVKAENILIDGETGRAIVTDFGIARLAEATPLTSTGQILGTVYYLSPEQVTGEPVDARSDIYALGVVGYFALSGRFPFNAELASAVLIAHVNDTAPPLHQIAPDAPARLTDIVDRCLCKNPDDRFQTCLELRSALDAIENLVIAEENERAAGASERSGEWNAGSQREVQLELQQTLLSDDETRDILARAATLQAATGVQPRPPAVIGSREHQPRPTKTWGHRVGNVRDAAREAGIAATYVDHALLEHGLTPTGHPAEAPLVVLDRTGRSNPFIGSPTQPTFEVVVNGEMPDRDFDLFVDIIRKHGGEAGQIGVVGRSFSWQSMTRRGTMQVTVLPRGGKTTIRVSQNLRALATALFAGLIGGIGGASVSISTMIALSTHNPWLGVAIWAGAVALSFLIAHGLFRLLSGSTQRKLRALAEELGVQARESIADTVD